MSREPQYPECYLNRLLWEGDQMPLPDVKLSNGATESGRKMTAQGQGECSAWVDEDPPSGDEYFQWMNNHSLIPGPCNLGKCKFRVPFGTKATTPKPNKREGRRAKEQMGEVSDPGVLIGSAASGLDFERAAAMDKAGKVGDVNTYATQKGGR